MTGAPEPGAAGAPDREEGGDPACWANRVCPECGRLADASPPTACPRCGAQIGG